MSESAGLAHYDALVHRIYDAANDLARWPAVMSGIAEVCSSNRCLLIAPRLGPQPGGVTLAHNIAPAALEHWSSHPDAIQGPVLPGERMATARFADKQSPAVLAVFRQDGAAPFDPLVLDLLERIVGHVARALGMLLQQHDGRSQLASTQATLNQMSAGAMLLDAGGVLGFANAAAQRQLARGDPIALTASGAAAVDARLALAGHLKNFQANFQRSIREALSPATLDAAHHTSTLVLPDTAGKPVWVLHVAPLRYPQTLASLHCPPPKAAVFLHDLGAAANVAPTLLNELFDLTPAEARAAVQVLRGGTAEEMAGRLGVAVCTFKSQLQLVYAKTGAHRQGELLKLFWALGVG